MSVAARPAPAMLVIAAGVCAALHVAKLPPAIAALQAALGLTLVEAGFLLSLVQLAGMASAVALGVLADGIGARRSMVAGLAVLALASAIGGLAQGVPALMLLRAVEGFGFLLVVLPAPGLVRALVPPERVALMLGRWGAYMPLGTALALLIGPVAIDAIGWRGWWWALGVLSAVAALVLVRAVPSDGARARGRAAAPPGSPGIPSGGWLARLARTLAAPGPWLVSLTFAVYSSQWLAVVGFLPTIVLAAGFSGTATGVLTALVAAGNMVGNIAAGRALHRGVAPLKLLVIGFVAMALGAAAAYAGAANEALLPGWARYLAVLAFSTVGGLIPATLFSLAVRLAPDEGTIGSTVGWMQQWSAAGQFAGPPLVAWVASRAGGWHWTWAVTGSAALVGLVLAVALARAVRARADRTQAAA